MISVVILSFFWFVHSLCCEAKDQKTHHLCLWMLTDIRFASSPNTVLVEKPETWQPWRLVNTFAQNCACWVRVDVSRLCRCESASPPDCLDGSLSESPQYNVETWCCATVTGQRGVAVTWVWWRASRWWTVTVRSKVKSTKVKHHGWDSQKTVRLMLLMELVSSWVFWARQAYFPVCERRILLMMKLGPPLTWELL
jgi:hypothetical protein